MAKTWLLGLLLVAPAWSQEPAPAASVAPAPTFDIRGDAVRKIVRDTAATQSAQAQPVENAATQRPYLETIEFAPSIKPLPSGRVDRDSRSNRPAKPSPEMKVVSAVLDTVVDSLLDSYQLPKDTSHIGSSCPDHSPADVPSPPYEICTNRKP